MEPLILLFICLWPLILGAIIVALGYLLWWLIVIVLLGKVVGPAERNMRRILIETSRKLEQI